MSPRSTHAVADVRTAFLLRLSNTALMGVPALLIRASAHGHWVVLTLCQCCFECVVQISDHRMRLQSFLVIAQRGPHTEDSVNAHCCRLSRPLPECGRLLGEDAVRSHDLREGLLEVVIIK